MSWIMTVALGAAVGYFLIQFIMKNKYIVLVQWLFIDKKIYYFI